jgi:hypothetical protein
MGSCHQRWSFLLHSICLLLVFLARPNACDDGELQLGTLDVLHHFSRCLRVLVMAREAYVCTARRRLHMRFVAVCRVVWSNAIKLYSMDEPSQLWNEWRTRIVKAV